LGATDDNDDLDAIVARLTKEFESKVERFSLHFYLLFFCVAPLETLIPFFCGGSGA